jgi:hypothetical protein
MKNAKQIGSQLNCKATASLNIGIEKDLEKEDKSLGDLLNEKEEDRDQNGINKSGDSCE